MSTLAAPGPMALCTVVAVSLLLGASTRALAQPTGDESAGVNIELQFATAYVFRGQNVFQSSSQHDPYFLLAPGISWAVADSGVTIGYWSAYQVNGNNIKDNIDAALGVEQDLYVSYDLELPYDLALALSFMGYLYPAADPDVAGATMPTYLEPGVSFTYSPGIDLGIAVSYLAGVQEAESIADYRYLYLNPSVGKTFELSDEIGLELRAGYGFKYFNSGNEGRDNIHDVLVSAALPVNPGGGIAYATPGLAAAWTNIEDVFDEETGELDEEKSFGDGFVVWASLALGVDL
jgi:hypothetical protein